MHQRAIGLANDRQSKVTITEVAKLAGVSTATAGRVLGEYGYTSEEIRLKVRRCAERLGYRPNQLARSLITGRTGTVGVVAGDIQSPFYASIMRGISDEARAAGFGVILTNSDEIAEREEQAVRLLLEKRVDGLIIAPCDMENAKYLRRAIREGTQIVQIDRTVRGLRASSITLNNRAAAKQAVSHLIAAGHRRIGILAELEHRSKTEMRELIRDLKTGTRDVRSMFPTWPRFLGYLDAHEEAGITVDQHLIIRIGSYSMAQAQAAAHELLSGTERPTALFTADGLMSASAINAVTALRLSIPEDLSLVAFDDLDWMTFYRPGITAVTQPLKEIGRQAAKLMLERIKVGDAPPSHVELEAVLTERGSVVRLS
jgi:LacI family transcriptional regulator